MKKFLFSRAKQAGFTALELIIVMAVSGLVCAGITGVVFQTLRVNAQSNRNMEAIQQVENAGYWMSHDALMAQEVTTSGGSGFPVTMSWQDWDGNSYDVTYTMVSDTLQRNLVINSGAPIQNTAADKISTSSSATNVQVASGVLTFKVTATAGTMSKERTYQIMLRPDAP